MATQTTAYVDCHHCPETHIAEPAGKTTFGNRDRFAVVCDDYTDYYTDEVVYHLEEPVEDLGIDLR
jgi:hypothetical protein